MRTELSPDLKNAINRIAEAIKPALDEIHKHPATTQNYYGDYMAMLGTVSPDKIKLLAIAMMEAGANPYGVESAVKIMLG